MSKQVRLWFGRLTLLLALVLCMVSTAHAIVYVDESFEDLRTGMEPRIPEGWESGGDIAEKWRFASHQTGYEGRCIRFSSQYGLNDQLAGNNPNGKKEILTSPLIEPDGNLSVSFWYLNPTGGPLSVYLSRDNGATYEGEPLLIDVENVTQWTHFEQLIQAETTDKIRLVFVAVSNAVSSGNRDAYNTAFASIDEVLVEDVPTCAQPIDLLINYADEKSVMLMWNTSPLGGTSPSEYIIDLYKGNDLIDTKTTRSTTILLEGLQSEESYTASIKGDCTPDHQQYSPASVINFTVPCPPRAIPYSEGFDSQNAGMLPCWTAGGTSGIVPSIQRQYFYQKLGETAIGSALVVASTVGGNTYAILPALPYDPEKPLEISCKAYATDALQRLEVGVVASPFDFSTYTSLGSQVLQANEWQDCSFNTKQYEAFDEVSVVYPVIYSKEGVGNLFYVDDIYVQYAEGCLRPTNVQATDIKPDQALISWYDANGDTGPWKVSYTPEGGAATVVDAKTNPFTLTGLDVQTVYQVSVASVCGGETSVYSSSTAFATPCEVFSLSAGGLYEEKFSSGTFPACWTPLAQFTDKSNNKAYPCIETARFQMRENTSAAVCGFDLPANDLRVRFDAKAAVGTTLVVGILKELNDPSSMVTVKTLQVPQAGANFEVLMDESTAAGDYVVFYANGEMNIDNLMIDQRPKCLAPQNLTLGKVTANTATFSWTTREPDAEYKVSVDDGTPVTVRANSYTIQDLEPGMSYSLNVKIEAVCQGANSETLIGKLAFITKCEPTTITKENPFVTEFAASVSAPPTCYTYVQTRSMGSYTFPRVKSKKLLLNGGSGAVIAALPEFTNPVGDLRILFTLEYDGEGAPTYPLEVGYLTDIDNPASFVSLSSVNLSSASLDVKIHLDKAPAEATHIALRASDPETGGNTQYTFALSNIKVELIPLCLSAPRITAVTGEKGRTSVTVTITDHEATITAWDIMAVPFGSEIGDDDNIIVTVRDKNAAVVTGLAPSTGYYLYVRSNCGDEVGDWSTDPFEVSTMCETIVITEDNEYKESFRGYMSPCYTTEVTGNMAPFSYAGGANGRIETSATSSVKGTSLVVTPQFEVVGPVELSFKMTSTAANQIPENVTNVYWNTTPTLDGATLLRTIKHSSMTGTSSFSSLLPFEKTNTSGDEKTTNFYVLFEVVVNDKVVLCRLDDITVAVADECFTPIIQSMTGLTQTTVGFSAFGAVGAEYEFVLIESGSTRSHDTIRSTTGKVTFGIEKPLEPHTQYEAKVRTICAGGTVSKFSETYVVTTLCEGINTVGEGRSYVDEFDEGTDTRRDCWLEYPGLTVPVTAAPGYNVSPQALRLTSEALRNRIAMPAMLVDDIRNYELAFQAYTDYPDVSFQIGLQGDMAASETFIPVKQVNLSETGVWKEQIVSFNDVDVEGFGLPVNCGNIVFYVTDRDILIDNVQFRVIPACPQVADLKVLPLGTKVNVSWSTRQENTPVRVVLTWNHDLRIDTIYNEIHTEKQITIENDKIQENSSGYSVVAQTVCDGGVSVWTAPVEFKTACALRDVPVEEDFDEYAWEEVNDQLFPDCWTRVKTYRHTSFGVYPRIIYGNNAASGKGCLDLWSSANEIMFALPEVTTDLADLTLSFKYSCYSREGNALRVGLLKDLGQDKGFREVVVCGKPEGVFEEMEVTFPAEVQGKGYRYVTFALDGGNYYIDDIKLMETPPAVRPGNINVTGATDNSVTFDVVDQVNVAWEVVVVPSGVDPDGYTVQPSDSKKGITYSGLEPSTVYDIYVRGVNKAEDYRSGWFKKEAAVRTDCGRVDVFPYVETFDDMYNTPEDYYISSCWTIRQLELGVGDLPDWWEEAWDVDYANPYRGNRAAMLQNGNPGTRTTLASPELAITKKNEYEVTFWMYREATSEKPIEGVRVWANTTPENLEGATLLLHATRCGGVLAPEKSVEKITETGWYRYSAPIPVVGNNVHILFEGINEGGKKVLIDEVMVRKVPSCAIPSDVAIDTVGAAMVTFTIEDARASKWDVAVVEQGKLPEAAKRIETVDTKTYTYNGLEESTEYSLYVRANCGGDEVSEWSRAYKFTTICDPVALSADFEYIEDFDSYPNGEIPDCWTPILEVNTGTWRSPAVNTEGSYAPSKPGSVQLSAGTMIALPAFSNNPADLVWSMRINGYGTLKIGTLNDLKNFNTFEAFADVEVSIIHPGTSPDGIAGTPYTFNLSEYADKLSGKYLALQADEDNGNAIYVDNVLVYYNNPCRRPDQVLVEVLGADGLQITINDERPDTEVAKWQYAVVPADTAVRPAYIKETVDRVVPVTDLEAGKAYDVYVRPLCDAGGGNLADGNWSEKISVATECVERTLAKGISDALDINASNMPPCWTIVDTYVDYWGNITPRFISGTGFYFDFPVEDNMVALPKYSNPLADLQVTISAQEQYRDVSSLDIGYVTDLSRPASFQLVQTIQVPASGVETTVVFAGVDAGVDGYIAIRGKSTGDVSRIYINAVEVSLAASFYTPRNFALQDVRSTSVVARAVVGSDTEKCHWQLSRLTEDGRVAYVSDIFTDGVNKGVLLIDTLQPATSYMLRVRAFKQGATIASDTTEFTKDLQFSTLCEEVIGLKEHFATDGLPACWTMIGEHAKDTNNVELAVIAGGDSLRFKVTALRTAQVIYPTNDVYIALPPVADLNKKYLVMDYTTDFAGSISVGTTKKYADFDTFNSLSTYSVGSDSTAVATKDMFVPFNTVSAEEYIAIRFTPNRFDFSCAEEDGCNATAVAAIDSIMVADITPDICLAPYGLEYTSEIDKVTLNWQPGNTETEWTVQINDGTPETVTGTPTYPIKDLDHSTAYTWNVRISPVCNTGSEANLMLVETVSTSTLCDPVEVTKENPYEVTSITTLPHCWEILRSGTWGSYPTPEFGDGIEFYGDNVLRTPEFVNKLNELTVIITAERDREAAAPKLEVGYVTDGADPASFVSVQTLTLSSAKLTEYKVDFDVDPTLSGYVAFRYSARCFTTVPKVVVRKRLACPDPVLSLKSATNTDITLEVKTTADNCHLIRVPAGLVIDPDTVKTYETLTADQFAAYRFDAAEGTEWDVYVRSACDAETSYWVSGTYAPLCSSLGALPYLQDFDLFRSGISVKLDGVLDATPGMPSDPDNPARPDCWTYLCDGKATSDNSTSNIFLVDIKGHSKSNNTMMLRACTYSTQHNPVRAVLPYFGKDANELRLMFSYKTSEKGSPEIGVMADPNNESTYMPILKLDRTTSYVQKDLSFENVPEGYGYIVFSMGVTSQTESYLWIDDIRVSCLDIQPTVQKDICANEDFIYDGIIINSRDLQPGQLNKKTVLKQVDNGGCDVFYAFELNVAEKMETVIYDTICGGTEIYNTNGFEIQPIDHPTTRKYYLPYKTVSGCDSIVCLDLYVHYPQHWDQQTVCANELPLHWGGMEITETGIYRDTIRTGECDSISILDVVVMPKEQVTSRTICEGDSVLFAGKQYKTTGRYEIQNPDDDLCKSMLVLDLTVLPKSEYLEDTICASDLPYTKWPGYEFYETGTYERDIRNELSCNLHQTLALTVLDRDTAYVKDTVCFNSPYTGYNGLPSSSGTANITESTTVYCDNDNYGKCGFTYAVDLYMRPEVEGFDTIEVNTLPYKYNDYLNITSDKTQEYTLAYYNTDDRFRCDSTLYVYAIINLTGLDDVTAAKTITIKPNPVERDQELTLDYEFTAAERKGMQIEIVNSLGQVISRQRPDTEVIRIGGFRVSGFYTIHIITGDDKRYAAKVLVK